MRLFIFGGRDFSDYKLLKYNCDELLKDIDEEIIIISGHANGADKLGERYAEEKGYKIELFPAKWDDLETIPCKIKYNKYGNPYNCLAGFNRNRDMVNISDVAIGFWDGKSKGTKDSINLCKKKDMKLKIILY